MPVDPHTWSDITDFWTPTLVNGDMYRYGGQEFVPTGIQFHARRAIYKSFAPQGSGSFASGSWFDPYAAAATAGNYGISTADTGHLFGAYMDPYNSGHFRLLIAGGGGTPGRPGGLGLVIGYAHFPALAGSVGIGLGDYTQTAPNNIGVFQRTNGSVDNTPFVIDIMDLATVRLGLFAQQNSGGNLGTNAASQVDGSQRASRLHAHWVSVYPSNGFTVSSVPSPVQSWSASSTLNASLLNGGTGIRDVLRFLNMPPVLRAAASGNQNLSANTVSVINTMSADVDTYGKFSANTYTVPLDGLYFVHGIVTTQNFNGELGVGVQINGVNYWGPRGIQPGGGYGSAAKTQIFSLRAGDTIKLVADPDAAATTSSNNQARLIAMHVSCLGAPANPPIPPDTTFRWRAGTPGDQSQLFNNYVANDLLFLTQRPYLMSYQSAAQGGIAQNTVTAVNMDKQLGVIHADDGDNFNGWNGTSYTAQVAGWYLAVQESFLATPSLTSSPWATAAFSPSPPGNSAWDEFQQWDISTSSAKSPGAAAVSYYYLRPGDTLTPGVKTSQSSNSTISTAVGTGVNSHFELVYLGE